MISINVPPLEIKGDTAVKRDSAQRQMKELVETLREAKETKYHILSPADRSKLIGQSYARDLVDNIIFLTRRAPSTHKASLKSDSLIIGFNFAAFDPSIYASDVYLNHIKHAARGCCMYCETYVDTGASGHISHFRPITHLDSDLCQPDKLEFSNASPYWDLAYQQSNLVFTCNACCQIHKSGRFPVAGKRYPEVSIDNEQSLLINPLSENPRDFIRFNPLNGAAFAFDRVVEFYQLTSNLSLAEIEKKIWQQPNYIPCQTDADGNAISNNDIDDKFMQWASKTVPNIETRGEVSIRIFGLNRPSLLLSRMSMLNQLSPIFYESKCEDKHVSFSAYQYRSLAIDAEKSCINRSISRDNASVKQASSSTILFSWNQNLSPTRYFPSWMKSSLIYMVPESELTLSGRRLIVFLNSRDKHYGKNHPEKCVFLPIDWRKDIKNTIKVIDGNHTWETTFMELSNSRPMDIEKLFSTCKLVSHGDYPALFVG